MNVVLVIFELLNVSKIRLLLGDAQPGLVDYVVGAVVR